MFSSTQAYPVLTHGAPSKANLVLHTVGHGAKRGAAPAKALPSTARSDSGFTTGSKLPTPTPNQAATIAPEPEKLTPQAETKPAQSEARTTAVLHRIRSSSEAPATATPDTATPKPETKPTEAPPTPSRLIHSKAKRRRPLRHHPKPKPASPKLRCPKLPRPRNEPNSRPRRPTPKEKLPLGPRGPPRESRYPSGGHAVEARSTRRAKRCFPPPQKPVTLAFSPKADALRDRQGATAIWAPLPTITAVLISTPEHDHDVLWRSGG